MEAARAEDIMAQGEVGGQGISAAPRDLEDADIDVHVGRRLRARREALGLSQGALGRRLGITFSQIQKYEKGVNRIGAGRLYRMASLLDVPVDYFYDELGTPPPRQVEETRAGSAAEASRLQEAFGRINDPQARHAVLSLVASLVDTNRPGRRG
jgi:transcriptional regulator with XRE-family HTH domain